jgi:predicted type IV restriction endonuclease
MKEQLVSKINEISNDKSMLILDEASIKTSVVLRLLSLIGWDPFDINEVKPEYTVESKRVDFSIRIDGINKVFIEVKRPNEDLIHHQEQLLDYSFRVGVKQAILTNGIIWWFYLPLNEGSWEQRRFFTADFLQQDTNDISDKFIELLSKKNIISGDALKNAEHLYSGHQKRKILLNTLPKAWYKILNDPDDLFIELLIETTEKLSGFRPEIKEVEKFIINMQTSQGLKPKVAPPLIKQVINSELSHKNKTSDYKYIGKQIKRFKLFGKICYPRTWKELLLFVSEEIYRRHSVEFNRCLSLRGSRMLYFSQQPNDLKQPMRIGDSNYFVETKLNSNSIVRRSHELMRLFGYKESELEVSAE